MDQTVFARCACGQGLRGRVQWGLEPGQSRTALLSCPSCGAQVAVPVTRRIRTYEEWKAEQGG